MLKQLVDIWKNNYGPHLFAIGSLVGLVMCVLWYLKLLPEVTFAQPLQLPRRLSSDGPACYFVARIEKDGTSPEDDAAASAGAVVVFVHDPIRNDEYEVPLLSKEFTLDEDGTATVVVELRAGTYTAYAYLDSTKNGRLDTDLETRQPLEPMATTAAGEQIGLEGLDKGEFTIAVDRPHFAQMTLSLPRQLPAVKESSGTSYAD